MEIATAVGTIVDARYQLIELLGEGGSGSTYSAIRLADVSYRRDQNPLPAPPQ